MLKKIHVSHLERCEYAAQSVSTLFCSDQSHGILRVNKAPY